MIGGMKNPADIEVPVMFNDGTTDLVIVRFLPQRMLRGVIDLCDKESQLIEYVCDKPENWTDNLSDGSFVALLEKSRELNQRRALEHGRRVLENLQVIAPAAQLAKRLLNVAVGSPDPSKN